MSIKSSSILFSLHIKKKAHWMPPENKQNNTGQTQTSGNQPSHLLSNNNMTPKSSPSRLEVSICLAFILKMGSNFAWSLQRQGCKPQMGIVRYQHKHQKGSSWCLSLLDSKNQIYNKRKKGEKTHNTKIPIHIFYV